ncbi:hypothetical protein T484DRAFT_1780810 [Baffinella frigidus]|nr:hypothetical protein T484DRAFT_1780810 [Cryptophyta sp. CCMP2293]
MKWSLAICAAALPIVADAFLAPAPGAFLPQGARSLHAASPLSFRRAAPLQQNTPVARQSRLGLRMQVIALVAVGFLFGALYPLWQNSIKYAQVLHFSETGP